MGDISPGLNNTEMCMERELCTALIGRLPAQQDGENTMEEEDATNTNSDNFLTLSFSLSLG